MIKWEVIDYSKDLSSKLSLEEHLQECVKFINVDIN